nr:hypothetical protein [Tanacetum cinerariifolium]
TPEACQDLVDHAAPPGYFSELRHMHNKEFLRQYNANLARQVARRDKRIQARELEIKNLEALLEAEADMKKAAEGKSAGLIQELEDMRARFSDLQVRNEHLSQQAFADVVSAEVVKGMSKGLKHGVEHGQAQLKVESIEAYDPEAEAKFVAALQSLKDLKATLGGMPYNIYATSAPAPLSSPSLCIRRSDGIPMSVPTVVPQGLALLLVDAATQTDLEDT